MVLPTEFIADIDSSKESWHIVARVVRLWKIPNFNNAKNPLALEMVLCDERGGRIHTVVRRTLVYKFQSTLIEGAAYSISNFCVGENSGEFKYSMHLYKLAKVKSFKGKVSLQNALHASKLIFNPDFDKAVELRKRLEENSESVSQPLSQIAEAPKMSIEEEFLTHTIMKTIEELKDTNEKCCCIVMATIKHLIDGEDWWYRLKVCVIDATDSATFVLFDRDVASILGISCSDLLESTDQAPDKQFPYEICSLVDKTFLFKVDKKIVSNSRFEQSYKVRKLCSDSQLIQQFKDIHFSKKADDSLDFVILDGQLLVGIDQCNDLPKEVDLLTQFSDSVNDNENNSVLIGSADGVGITMDSECITPCKRNSDDFTDDPIVVASSMKMKKTIKQEKD
ncbi:Nucleic acid-binding, OB-fold [Sesbania bispinosa]|nr:Nucleic acid-binding, OB-fold [Sesbania bispinosa]